jgi:hypothetical protein
VRRLLDRFLPRRSGRPTSLGWAWIGICPGIGDPFPNQFFHLYAKGGKAKFVYNVLGITSYEVESSSPIPAGKTQVRMEFAYDGKAVGKGRVDQTQGFVFSADETTDIGYESGTSVSRDYDAHSSRFNGKINWVQIDLDKDAQDADHFISPEDRLRIAMARQ